MARKFWVKKDETQQQPLWALSSDEFGPHDRWYYKKKNLNLKKTISPTTFSSEVNRKLESLYLLQRSISNVFCTVTYRIVTSTTILCM